MKITVIGAGAIGSAVARDLLAEADVAQVQVCDAHARSLQTLHDQMHEADRCHAFQVDARYLAKEAADAAVSIAMRVDDDAITAANMFGLMQRDQDIAVQKPGYMYQAFVFKGSGKVAGVRNRKRPTDLVVLGAVCKYRGSDVFIMELNNKNGTYVASVREVESEKVLSTTPMAPVSIKQLSPPFRMGDLALVEAARRAAKADTAVRPRRRRTSAPPRAPEPRGRPSLPSPGASPTWPSSATPQPAGQASLFLCSGFGGFGGFGGCRGIWRNVARAHSQHASGRAH
jgi:hypothetical protein